MKTIYRSLVMLLALAFAWSCSSESATTDAITLSSEETQIISASGGKLYFNFTTNGSWKAHVPNTQGYDWSSILPTSGEGGDNTITVTVLPNTTNEARTMTFTIYSGSVSYEVAVMQLSADGFAVVTKKFTVPAEGADIEVQVVSNIGYTYSVSDSWITVADTKALETSSVTFTVAENKEFEERVGTIEFTAGEVTETVTVTQEAVEPYFYIVTEGVDQYGQSAVVLPQEGGSFSFEVETNLDFVAATDGKQDWLTVTQDGNTITVSAEANAEYSPLEDYVYISCSHNGESYDDYGGYVLFQQEQNELFQYSLSSTTTLSDNGINRGGNSIAYSSGYLLVLDSAAGKIHALSGSDLSYGTSIDVSALGAASIASDDAGHVLIANECGFGATFTVYCASSISDTPTQLISYVNNVYTNDDCPMGNIKVRGDVTGDAVVSVYSPVYNYAVVWEIKGGVVGEAKEIEVTPKNIDNCWSCYNGVVAPIGTSFSDGLYMGSYSKPFNELEYYNASEKSWSCVTTLLNENYNLNCLRTVEVNGVPYMGIVSSSFFSWSESCLTMFMVSDPASPVQIDQKYVSEWSSVFTDGAYDGFGQYISADIVMIPADGGITVFALDASYDTIARIDYK